MKEVQDLPSGNIGLGVLNLSLLTPGVSSSGGLGAGTGPSISGQRPRNNNFTIDGIDNNSKSVTGPLLYVPNDAVSEFVLLQNVYSAQYGHSAGGQFNSLIVPGTNHIHGRAYEYFQNRNLNAVDTSRRSRTLRITRRQILSLQTSSPASTSTGTAVRSASHPEGQALLLLELRAPDHGLRGQLNGDLRAHRRGITTLNGMAFASATNYSVYKKYVLPAPTQAPAGKAVPSCTDSKASPGGATILVANAAGVKTPVAVGALSVPSPNSFNYYFSTNSLDYTISQHDTFVRDTSITAEMETTRRELPGLLYSDPGALPPHRVQRGPHL